MKKPSLIKVSETLYGCSSCKDWTATMDTRKDNTPAAIQERAEKHFANHFKQVHLREDASQAAARIVREATEDR
jgi:hypothetical protein